MQLTSSKVRHSKTDLGLTRFRRGLQSSAGHTEGSGFLVNPSEKV